MGLLDRLRGKLDIVSTPTAPKIGRIPLPEIDSPVPVRLTLDVAASYVDDEASSSSGELARGRWEKVGSKERKGVVGARSQGNAAGR